MGTEYTKAC